MKIKIEVSCCLCMATTEGEIDAPDWGHYYGTISEENALCPAHAKVVGFLDSQCPGCVSGWPDCGLGKAFMYRSMDLSDTDMQAIRAGRCPKRVNGTFSFNPDESPELKEVNLSEAASSEAGVALATAIQDYSDRYHGKSNG